MEEVVPVASQRHTTTLVGELQNSLVGGIAWKSFVQQSDTVTGLFE